MSTLPCGSMVRRTSSTTSASRVTSVTTAAAADLGGDR